MAGDSKVDLTKLVRKAETIRLPILSVSSSPQEISLIQRPDHDDSGNMKRKLENMESATYNNNNNKIQELTYDDGESEMMMNIIKNTTTDDQVVPRYVCSLCSKTFTSHRALGGHKSSHNKFKITICDAIDLRVPKNITNTCSTDHQQIAASSINIIHAVVGDDDDHTCKICFHNFPSGQALGGHQRRHRTGNSTNKTPKILDFDLNKLPKEEEDEDTTSAN